MAVDHDEVEAGGGMRGCCTWTTAVPRRRSAAPIDAATPPQPITRSGNGGAIWPPTAASAFGQSDAGNQRQGGRGASGRITGYQPGGLGQPERLCLQAGIILAEDPGVGGIGHRPRNTGRRFSL